MKKTKYWLIVSLLSLFLFISKWYGWIEISYAVVLLPLYFTPVLIFIAVLATSIYIEYFEKR